MCHKIAGAQFVKFLEGNDLIAVISLFAFVLLITPKNLVLGVKSYFGFVVNKTFMQYFVNWNKFCMGIDIFKNSIKALYLLWLVAKNDIGIAFIFIRL